MVRISAPPRRGRRTLLTLTAAVALVGSAVAPAQAHDSDSHHRHHAKAKRVASGLDNPRQLVVTASRDVYVAEAGTGGTGLCKTGPEGDEVCFGTSGAVTRVDHHGRQSRVVKGLPSLAARDGSAAIGPSDVEYLGDRKLAVLIGLGANPAERADLPGIGQKMGTLQSARIGSSRMSTIADLAAYEASANPIHDPDSNPSSMIRVGDRYVITDAGGNDLVRTREHHRLSTVAVFDDQMADAPPFLGLPPGTKIPAQAVPTAVVRGPDGAYYVSQLTGFPFQPGLANIYRVVRGHAPTVWASGLTNVTSLAFDSHGSLYAVQLAKDGLLNAPPDAPPMGSLVKVSHGSSHQRVVADNLVAPYGVAIRGHDAYVSTCSVCPGGGEVWRIAL